MIKKFQNQRLGILRDIHQIEAFRTPDHVELTEFMAIDLDLLQNCAWGLNVGCYVWCDFQVIRLATSHSSVEGQNQLP